MFATGTSWVPSTRLPAISTSSTAFILCLLVAIHVTNTKKDGSLCQACLLCRDHNLGIQDLIFIFSEFRDLARFDGLSLTSALWMVTDWVIAYLVRRPISTYSAHVRFMAGRHVGTDGLRRMLVRYCMEYSTVALIHQCVTCAWAGLQCWSV